MSGMPAYGPVVQWFTDLATAATDLGYGIEVVEYGRIDLIAKRDGVKIIIESRHLSGALLREILRDREAKR